MSMVETKRCKVNGGIPASLVYKRNGDTSPFYARVASRMYGHEKVSYYIGMYQSTK